MEAKTYFIQLSNGWNKIAAAVFQIILFWYHQITLTTSFVVF